MTLSRLQTLSLGSVPLRGLQVTYFEGSTLASVHQNGKNSSHLMRVDRLGRVFRHSDGSFTRLLQLLKDDLVLIAGIIFHPLVSGIQEAYKSVLSTIDIFSFQGSSNWWSASEWFNKKCQAVLAPLLGFLGKKILTLMLYHVVPTWNSMKKIVCRKIGEIWKE